jgi:copper(I)-binding protein
LKKLKLQFVLAIALTLCAVIAFTITVRAGSLQVGHAYAPVSIGAGKTGAVYFMIVNETETPDRLVSAKTPAARKAEVHNHLMQDGIMKMRKVDGLEIAAGGRVMFKPGGYHLMLFGLTAPLKEGSSIEVELTFEQAGTVTLQVPIKPLGHKMMKDHTE